MRLVIASGNVHKLEEITASLKPAGVDAVGMKDAGFDGPLPPEDADDLKGNAAIKAEAVSTALGEAALADDSGLMVDALDGRPGVMSARYAGPDADYTANNQKLLEELAGVPEEKRTARFVCVMALARPGQETLFFRGEVEGKILLERTGETGFGYDPLFFSPELGRAFADDPEGKAKVSHRVRALGKVVEYLKKEAPCG